MDSNFIGDKRYRRLLAVTTLLGFVASTIIIFVCWNYSSIGSPRVFTDYNSLRIAVGSVPYSQLYTIDESKHVLKPLQVSTQEGDNHYVLSNVTGNDGSEFYILSDATTTLASNLYYSTKNSDITQLTNTQTVKYGLSYNKESEKLVYQEAHTTKLEDLLKGVLWELVVFDLKTKTKRIIGAGTEAHFASNGSLIIARIGSTLKSINSVTGSSTPIMELPQQVQYAINANSTALIIYNVLTHAIDEFTISNGASISYKKSYPVPQLPTAIGFWNDSILVSYPGVRVDNIFTYMFIDLTGKHHAPHPVTGIQGGVPQSISTYE